MERFSFKGSGGVEISGVFLHPENPKGTVFICHGLGEHIGRYEELFSHFLKWGFSIFGMDHRGHGRSGGRRGHIDRFSQYIEDFSLLYKEGERRGGRKPFLQFGHSMGGLIATHLAFRHQNLLSGLILSSPLFAIRVKVPVWKEKMGKFLSRFLGTLTMKNEVDPRLLSHDPREVKAYMEDPLVHQKVSARWFTEILSAMNEVDTIARSLKIPLLLLHGTEDGLTDPEGSKRFFSLLPHTPHQEIHLIEGGYHELFHELLEYREKSYRIVEEWIRKVEKAPSTG